MLKIVVPDSEQFNENTNEFFHVKGQTLSLEHSLISISKWEAKWHKPFFCDKEKTYEETIDYIRSMTLTPIENPSIYYFLTAENLKEINDYIQDPMTATWFKQDGKKGSREIITSELIYYWLIALGIPFDPCQKWHINRLLTLIRVCDIKSQPSRKMSKREVLANNRALNAQRRASRHTKG